MTLALIPVMDIPEIKPDDPLAQVIADHIELQDNDVVVVTSKVVSKSEGRVVDCDRDDQPARAALIQSESRRILRTRGHVFITETHHGFICANAGIDWSNSEPGHALLLPERPDKSAHDIRNAIRGSFDRNVAVVISDSFGRTWRNGTVDVAIGCAGITAIDDQRGNVDSHGNTLTGTQICTVDEVAAAASLVMGKMAGIPVVIVRGLNPSLLTSGSVTRDVIRDPALDLFR
jgi:coenzyme F420-0:L-glutamate ligase / coenzyme F420-1:gamma-L-glutamate ligase